MVRFSSILAEFSQFANFRFLSSLKLFKHFIHLISSVEWSAIIRKRIVWSWMKNDSYHSTCNIFGKLKVQQPDIWSPEMSPSADGAQTNRGIALLPLAKISYKHCKLDANVEPFPYRYEAQFAKSCYKINFQSGCSFPGASCRAGRPLEAASGSPRCRCHRNPTWKVTVLLIYFTLTSICNYSSQLCPHRTLIFRCAG